MINVSEAIQSIPHFDKFCSVETLNKMAESLRSVPGASVETVGLSERGNPVYHVTAGHGPVRALFVAGLHCMEPIGNMTVFSLMHLIANGFRPLFQCGVEWHVIPCIDPDGMALNEGWTQEKFSLKSHMCGYFVQPAAFQADQSFSLAYKRLKFDRPSREASILREVIDRIEPDFYCALHNARVGDGGFILLSRSINVDYIRQLRELLKEFRIPLRAGRRLKEAGEFGDGVYRVPGVRAYYDSHEDSGLASWDELQREELGRGSHEYLTELKPDALCLVPELSYVRHPCIGCEEETGENFRQLKLKLDADAKFLIAEILTEWDKVESDLDKGSPLFRKLFHELVRVKDLLHNGVPFAWVFEKTREIMFSPAYGRNMTRGERFFAWMWGRYIPLCNGYTFVRLLRESRQTSVVGAAIGRMQGLFDGALSELEKYVESSKFELIDHDTLAGVQLGAGLIGVNSVLAGAGQGGTR
jgi:hypothetical protein